MTREWTTTTLEEVCTTITDGAHFSPKEDPSGHPMASVKDLTNHGIELKNCKRISSIDFEMLKRQGCMPEFGDVLIAKDGNSALDTVCVHRLLEEVVLLSSVAILRPNKRIDADFLSYYLDAPQTRSLLKMCFRSGSAIPRVVLKDFRRAPVIVPPLPEQRAIARILGSLDDKIELNRRMNQTLEKMAREIFKSWFVNFDPVHAKMGGHAPAGMDAKTAALFPDQFEESELGMVPKGWEAGSIADIAEYVNGKNFTKNASGTGRIVIRIAELNSGPGSSTKYNDVKANPKNTAYPDDILFAWSGSLGVYRWHDEEALINQHIFKVICQKYPKWFVYHHLCDVLPFFREIASDKATTMGHIKRAHLYEAKLVIPSEFVITKASKTIEPLYQKIHQNELQSRTLTAIRNALLPKLISGEIRVKDAGKYVGWCP